MFGAAELIRAITGDVSDAEAWAQARTGLESQSPVDLRQALARMINGSLGDIFPIPRCPHIALITEELRRRLPDFCERHGACRQRSHHSYRLSCCYHCCSRLGPYVVSKAAAVAMISRSDPRQDVPRTSIVFNFSTAARCSPGITLSTCERDARAGGMPAPTFSNLVGLKWLALTNGTFWIGGMPVGSDLTSALTPVGFSARSSLART